MGKTRVLLVDDKSAVRRGLRMCLELEADLQVVGEAGDGLEALRLAGELDPDVVVLEVALPGMDGLTAASVLGKAAPRSQVVFLTLHDDARTRRRAYLVGGLDLVGKHACPDVLVAAIRRAAAISQSYAGVCS
jgi:DNA-binding NarL/FixJ family response regulator